MGKKEENQRKLNGEHNPVENNPDKSQHFLGNLISKTVVTSSNTRK